MLLIMIMTIGSKRIKNKSFVSEESPCIALSVGRDSEVLEYLALISDRVS